MHYSAFMYYKPHFLFALAVLNVACTNNDVEQSFSYQNIYARDNGNPLQREAIYRAKIPQSWFIQETSNEISNSDTKKPICELFIRENSQEIRITIHNFPSIENQARIPPNAQIARWKNQFDHLQPESITLIPQSFNGFAGYLFEGKGIITEKITSMMAWALQLAPQHIRQLSDKGQQSADVTIKAAGDPRLMQKHRDEIITFARSFELIQEIPPTQ